jgi:hypothetical protein
VRARFESQSFRTRHDGPIRLADEFENQKKRLILLVELTRIERATS